MAFETGLGRADLLNGGTEKVRQGHYLFAVAVLTIPALAFVIEALVRYWRQAAPVVAVVMVLAIAVNGIALQSKEDDSRAGSVAFRTSVLLIPRLPVATVVARSTAPFPGVATPLTVGWLIDQLHAGRLPDVKHATPEARARAILQVSLGTGGTVATPCHPLTGPVQKHLLPGEALHFRGPDVMVEYVVGNRRFGQVSFRPPAAKPFEWKLVNHGSVLTVTVRRSVPTSPTQICD